MDSNETSVGTRPATAIKTSDRPPTEDTPLVHGEEVKVTDEHIEQQQQQQHVKSIEKSVSEDASVKIMNKSQSVSVDTAAGDTQSDIHDTVSLAVHPATAGTAGTVDSKTEGSRASPLHEPEVFTVQTPPTSAESRIQSGKDAAHANEGASEEAENQLVHAASQVIDRLT